MFLFSSTHPRNVKIWKFSIENYEWPAEHRKRKTFFESNMKHLENIKWKRIKLLEKNFSNKVFRSTSAWSSKGFSFDSFEKVLMFMIDLWRTSLMWMFDYDLTWTIETLYFNLFLFIRWKQKLKIMFSIVHFHLFYVPMILHT